MKEKLLRTEGLRDRELENLVKTKVDDAVLKVLRKHNKRWYEKSPNQVKSLIKKAVKHVQDKRRKERLENAKKIKKQQDKKMKTIANDLRTNMRGGRRRRSRSRRSRRRSRSRRR
tara:strand:+ start:53 stop:397 length:345 start_codon:yes stop_codon:yes gene_type:complete